MQDQLHGFATNYIYAVPAAMALTALWLHFQKTRMKTHKTLIDTKFITRNSIFAGLVAFMLVYLGKPLPLLEESINVSPANF